MALAVLGCGEERLNRPPAISAVLAAPAQVSPGGAVSVGVTASDPDGDNLRFSWTIPAGWTAIGGTDRSGLALQAPDEFAAAAVVLVTVTDAHGGSASAQTMVTTIANEAPTFTSIVATPNPVVPGGTVSLAALAESPFGATLTYTWSVAGAGWEIAGTFDAATLVAPLEYGAAAAVTVVADDGHGLTATGELTVTTLPYAAPSIDGLAVSPWDTVEPGGTIQVTAMATSPNGLALTYAWTVADSTWSVTGTGPTAAVTASEEFAQSTLLTLEVTDEAGASTSRSIALFTQQEGAPVARIAGTPPLLGVINGPVALDGSGSTSPMGHPLAFNWFVPNAPGGAQYWFSNEVDPWVPPWGAKLFFHGDTAGTYDLVLEVRDVTDGSLRAYASTQVQLTGATNIVVVSGDAQQGPVNVDLPHPLVVKVVDVDNRGLPGQNLFYWVTGGATIFGVQGTTDENGEARLGLRPGRVAGAGTVTVFLAEDSSIKRTLTFTGMPRNAAAISVGAGVGSVIDGITLNVQTADEYGNFASDNTGALTSSFRLVLTSPSGQAKFTGDVTTLAVALVAGKYSVKITDTVAEEVHVDVLPPAAGSAGLPFSAWTVTTYDNFEPGLGPWTGMNDVLPPWDIATGASKVKAGSRAIGVELLSSETLAEGMSVMARPLSGATPITLVDFQHQVTVTPVAVPDYHCTAQPSLVTFASRPSGDMLLQSFTGYPVVDICAGPPSYASTTGFEAQRVDVTDAIQAGYNAFGFWLGTGAAELNAPSPVSWYVDELKITQLSDASLMGAMANARFLPGPAKKVVIEEVLDALQYLACPTGTPEAFVAYSILDAKDNVTQDSELIFRLKASGAGVPVEVLDGTLVTTGAHYADVKFDAGRAAMAFADPTTETVTFSIGNEPGAYAGLDVTDTGTAALGAAWVCHDAAFLASWADTAPLDTYNSTEAMRACIAYFERWPGEVDPTRPCAVRSDAPNSVSAFDGPAFSNTWLYYAYGDGSPPVTSGHCRPRVDAGCAAIADQCPVYHAGDAIMRWNAVCTTPGGGGCPAACQVWTFTTPPAFPAGFYYGVWH